MKTISQLVEHQQETLVLQNKQQMQPADLSSDKSESLENKVTTQQHSLRYERAVVRLYERMTVMYGRIFTSVNGVSAIGDDGKLTVAAETWLICIKDLSLEQIAKGLEKLVHTDKYDDFGITAKQFRKICLERSDLPTLDHCIMVLSHIQQRKGTVVERFEHPLILAINRHSLFDFHNFMQMDMKSCKSHLKPIYDDLAANGFPEFMPEHFENQIAIERILTDEEKTEAEAEKQRKAETAAEARKQFFSFGKLLKDDEPKKSVITDDDRLAREQSAEPTPEQIAERAARKAFLQAQAKMLMEKTEQEELANA